MTVRKISDLHQQNNPAPRMFAFADQHTLADEVIKLVSIAVTTAVQQYGHANLVFSGGTTPEFFLPRLAAQELPWEKVSVVLADERWVDEDSIYSNTAMLRRTLLNRTGPDAAQLIPLKNSALTASAGVNVARANLPPLDQPYDLVLLGMGLDGHIASLFPGAPKLAAALASDNTDRLIAVPPPTTATPVIERISFTLAEIKRSRKIVLVLQGEKKLAALKQAWQTADPLRAPVYALGAVDVLWCP